MHISPRGLRDFQASLEACARPADLRYHPPAQTRDVGLGTSLTKFATVDLLPQVPSNSRPSRQAIRLVWYSVSRIRRPVSALRKLLLCERTEKNKLTGEECRANSGLLAPANAETTRPEDNSRAHKLGHICLGLPHFRITLSHVN